MGVPSDHVLGAMAQVESILARVDDIPDAVAAFEIIAVPGWWLQPSSKRIAHKKINEKRKERQRM